MKYFKIFADYLYSRWAFLPLLIASLLVATPFTYSQSLTTSPSYYNAEVGVKVSFENKWDFFTTYENSPEAIKPNFSRDKGPNDSPLFFALHQNQQLFSRLLIEPFSGSLEQYAVLLGQGISEQGLVLQSAKMSTNETAVELVYQHNELGLIFKERASLLDDGNIIRMAVWSNLINYEELQPEMEGLFDGAELVGVVGGTSGWSSTWSGLKGRLSSQSILGVSINSSGNGSGGLSCKDSSATMLWQVETEIDTNVKVFLFGSIHLGKPDFYPLSSPVEAIFNQADYVVFEVDPEATADPDVSQAIQARGVLPQGQALSDFVSQQTILTLNEVLLEAGVPVEPFLSMKPWLTAIVLSTLQIVSLGYSPEFGVENYLMRQKPTSTKVLELEGIEQQISFLEELNNEVYLKYTLDSFESSKKESEQLIEAWRCSDKAVLTQILFDEFESEEGVPAEEQLVLANLKDKLFFERNENMADGIQSFLEGGENGTYFVVVGSGHLLGEGSVIDLLRRSGYSIRPVMQ